jgi:hypothetical protein
MKFRLPQFSMRVLVVGMLLLGAGLGLVGRELFQIRSKAQEQRAFVAQLKSKGVRLVEKDRTDLTVFESLAVWIEGKDALSVVTEVKLSQGGLPEEEVQNIAKLEGLKSVSDEGKNFSDKSLELLGQNPTLETVSLYNGHRGSEAGAIALVSGKAPLSSLHLNQTTLTDEFVQAASKLPKLETFIIDAHKISPNAIASLVQSPRLSFLELKNAKGIGEALKRFATHPTLKSLTLRGYTFEGDELESIAKSDQIEMLILVTPQFPRGVLRSLAQMKNLKLVGLFGNLSADEGFHPFQSAQLEGIAIDGLPDQCPGLIEFLSKCKSLKQILLVDVPFTDDDLERLGDIKGLQSIAIGPGPSSEAVSRLQKSVPQCMVSMRQRDGRIFVYKPGGQFELRQPPPIVQKPAPKADKLTPTMP